MTAHKLTLTRFGFRHLAAALASSAILTAGCANMETTAVTSPTPAAEGATLSGKLHGGNQPVTGATVQIYTVGQAGNGVAGALLATTTTDQNGNFSFTNGTSGTTYPSSGNTYSCPSVVNGKTIADPYLYIKTTGGNTSGGTGSQSNSAAVFLAPLGACSTINSSTFVNISEVTTAATVAALAQFINPTTEGIGGDGIGTVYQAIANQYKTIQNMVNLANGQANSTATINPVSGAVGVTGVSMTATIEATKLNTVANILSSCINQATATSASNCSTLFANAVPPANAARTSQPSASFPTASDTLQAALYMFLNPTDSSATNRQNLFNLQPATGAPFQPTVTSLPSDWTVGIAYSTSNVCAGSTAPFFNHPYDLNLDVSGNVWLTNNASNGALIEISNYGAPATCSTLNTKGLAGGTIDVRGNIWYGDSVNNKLYRYTPGSGAISTYTTNAPVLALSVDGTGAIFFSTSVNGTGSLYKIANGAGETFPTGPVLISNTVGPNPTRIFPDTAQDLWVTSGAGFVTQVQSTTGGQNFIPVGSGGGGYASIQYSIVSPTYGVVVGPNNRVYVTSADPAATLTILTPTGTTFNVTSTTNANTGGLSNPQGLWIDGAQNSWVANNGKQSSNNLYSLSVLAVDGTAVSNSGSVNGGYQKSTTYLNAPRQVVVDGGGNVWVTNDNNANSVTQIVGAGVPIYEPYSAGLTNGLFMTNP
jgi:hypothetical protein